MLLVLVSHAEVQMFYQVYVEWFFFSWHLVPGPTLWILHFLFNLKDYYIHFQFKVVEPLTDFKDYFTWKCCFWVIAKRHKLQPGFAFPDDTTVGPGLWGQVIMKKDTKILGFRSCRDTLCDKNSPSEGVVTYFRLFLSFMFSKSCEASTLMRLVFKWWGQLLHHLFC